MNKEKEKIKPAKPRENISLYPLDFEETLEKLLQVEPEKKKPAKKEKSKPKK
jgi:hypothetical protein